MVRAPGPILSDPGNDAQERPGAVDGNAHVSSSGIGPTAKSARATPQPDWSPATDSPYPELRMPEPDDEFVSLN